MNNALAFPGLFRGALDAGARCINNRMKIAAAEAIAEEAEGRPLRSCSRRASTSGSRLVERTAYQSGANLNKED